jgi:hypothetical protein
MFKRKISVSLEQWRDKQERKPLILRGARQVGKTTVVNEFSKQFDNYLYLNIERSAIAELFEKTDDVDELVRSAFYFLNIAQKEGTLLIFIDEIQFSPKAVALLRYFYEDRPDIFVIAAGSLLESFMGRHISFPVGRVEYMALRPCSFIEFLSALGEEQLSIGLENMTLPDALHTKVLKLFNEFVLVGGMPEAIQFYSKTKDLVALAAIFENLLTAYTDDIEKYAENKTLQRVIRHILNHGWQYAGERIKFERFANSPYKSREMGEAMRVLEKAMLIELSYPTNSTSLPVFQDVNKSPKLLWIDTGLVNYFAGFQKELFTSEDISDVWKGKVAEHIVGQELIALSLKINAKRAYWVRDVRNSQAEVDFVYNYNGILIPIEVKSGHNAKLKSLHKFMESAASTFAIRFWNQAFTIDTITLPSSKTYTLYNIPFYYAGLLDKFLEKKI